MGRVKGMGRGRGERRENLQLIDRHQSTPPSRTNQELRLPAYGVSQKNNVIGQAYFFPSPSPSSFFALTPTIRVNITTLPNLPLS